MPPFRLVRRSYRAAPMLVLAFTGCAGGKDAPEEEAPITCASACTGDFVVETAADMAAVAGCTEISGSLAIRDPDLDDLHALTCLTSVGGDLAIGGAIELPTDGTAIPAEIGPVRLTSLQGLDRLETVGGTLWVGVEIGSWWAAAEGTRAGPVRLTSLDGAPALRSVGALTIGSPPNAYMPSGLLDQEIPLVDLSGLAGVSTGDVVITLTGTPVQLPALTVAEGSDLSLSGAGIGGVAGPTWPATLGTVSLTDTSLTTLDGMEAVTDATTLAVTGNAALTDLSGLGVLTARDVTLDTEGVSLDGALPLTRVSGDLRITGDSTPCANVTAADTVTLFQGGHPTSRLDGLRSLERVDTATLIIEGEDDLEDLAALREVRSLSLSGSIESVRGLSDGLTIRSLSVARAGIVDLTGLPAGTGIRELFLYENADLARLDGLEDVTPGSPYIVQNPSLAQCTVDAFLEARGLPFDERIEYGEPSGNAQSCMCDADGVPTCPDPRCTVTRSGSVSISSQAEAAAFADVTCAELIYLFGGPTEFSLPNLVSAEMIVSASASTTTISLPALERVGKVVIGEFATSGARAPLTTVSMPSLTRAFDLVVAGPDHLVRFDTPLLTRVVNLDVTCADRHAPATPLESLDLGSLTSADSVRITDCASLPECAVEADLADAVIGSTEVYGLDASCTCDADGEASSCGGS